MADENRDFNEDCNPERRNSSILRQPWQDLILLDMVANVKATRKAEKRGVKRFAIDRNLVDPRYR